MVVVVVALGLAVVGGGEMPLAWLIAERAAAAGVGCLTLVDLEDDGRLDPDGSPGSEVDTGV